MNTLNVEQLNKDFLLESGGGTLRFYVGRGDIPVAKIRNEQATASISLQGAHVLSWVPAGGREVIWVSEDAMFALARSLRGGIPICWPRFGPHESNTAFPAHGFARTVLWKVADTQQLATGETQITFKLDPGQLDDKFQKMWPLATLAEYRVTIGRVLTMELITHNYSDQPMTIGQALHTYFAVDDVSKTMVVGLEGKDYLDKTDGFKRKTQSGPITISSEVDRVYLQTPDDVAIDDGKRRIIIKKQGSRSTVVWNPWKEAAEKMGDMGKDGYLKMLCVESANAAEDVVSIGTGESHTLRVVYEIAASLRTSQ